jgi:hypothetical protein
MMKFCKNNFNVTLLCAIALLLPQVSSVYAQSSSGAFVSPVGAGQTVRNIPSELFKMISENSVTFPQMMRYAGSVGAIYDSSTDKVIYWMLPNNPVELQYRPLPYALGTIKRKSLFYTGIRVGYIVDQNLAALPNDSAICDSPDFLSDGKRLGAFAVTGQGGSSSLVLLSKDKEVRTKLASSNLLFHGFSSIADSKVLEYSTCGSSHAEPKRVVRLTKGEQEHFRRLFTAISTAANIPYKQKNTSNKAPNQKSTSTNIPSVPTQPSTATAPTPPTALIADITNNSVTLNKGTQAGFQAGAKVSVERVTRVVKDPNTGRILRSVTSPVGTIQLTDVQNTYSIGKIISGQGFNVGDIVKLAP